MLSSAEQLQALLPEPLLTAFGWVQPGGPIVWILLGLATLALAIVLLKCWQFALVGVGRVGSVSRALRHWHGPEDNPALLDQLADRRGPAAVAVRTAVTGLANGYAAAQVREEVQRVANNELERLRSYLRALGLISTVSPLLGLLGTVIGMIAAFQGIEGAGPQVNAADLSAGIWQALLTTAVGLSVAIPVALAHAWLDRRVDRLAASIENLVTVVFTARLQSAAHWDKH
jgi:biopolymer transport protein ExbB